MVEGFCAAEGMMKSEMRIPRLDKTPIVGIKIRRFLTNYSFLVFGCLLAAPAVPAIPELNPWAIRENPRKPGSLRADGLQRFAYTQYHMGVDARIVVYAPNQKTAEDACIAAFARIAELDSIMSDYRVDSELNRLCARAGGPAVQVSPDLFTVLHRAQEVSRKSDGAFDITCRPIVTLWRKARKSGILPDPTEIETARKLVGWQKVTLDEKTRSVRLAVPGMKLDLGGIAKGYADDCAQNVLKKFGVTRALVEMGGDIVVTGPPPGKEGWTIRVPNAGSDQGPVDMQFSASAISTSGDTEQFVIIGGKRYSHIVDPRTGQALTNRVEVTLVAPDGLTSDPLTKTLCVLEREKADKVLKSYPGVKAYFRVLRADQQQ